MGLALSCWLVLFTAAFMLWARLRAVENQVRGFLAESTEPTAANLLETILEHVGSSMLPSANHQGLESVSVVCRENQDPYRTVLQLVQHLSRAVGEPRLADRERQLKATYQLQATLGLSDNATDALIGPVLEAMKRSTFLDRPIGGVTRVHAGDLVDRRTMWPLSSGARVRQPLGAVIHDESGAVVSKAKVVCC